MTQNNNKFRCGVTRFKESVERLVEAPTKENAHLANNDSMVIYDLYEIQLLSGALPNETIRSYLDSTRICLRQLESIIKHKKYHSPKSEDDGHELRHLQLYREQIRGRKMLVEKGLKKGSPKSYKIKTY